MRPTDAAYSECFHHHVLHLHACCHWVFPVQELVRFRCPQVLLVQRSVLALTLFLDHSAQANVTCHSCTPANPSIRLDSARSEISPVQMTVHTSRNAVLMLCLACVNAAEF